MERAGGFIAVISRLPISIVILSVLASAAVAAPPAAAVVWAAVAWHIHTKASTAARTTK